MTRFVGIDYSSRKVAIAVLDADRASLWSFEAPRRITGRDSTQLMFEAFYHWAGQTGQLVDAEVMLEAPITGASNNRQIAAAMAAAFGGLWFGCLFHGAAGVEFAAPSQWKKSVVGHGNASKEDVQAWLAEHHPTVAMTCKNDDEADAMCMALMAYEAGVR